MSTPHCVLQWMTHCCLEAVARCLQKIARRKSWDTHWGQKKIKLQLVVKIILFLHLINIWQMSYVATDATTAKPYIQHKGSWIEFWYFMFSNFQYWYTWEWKIGNYPVKLLQSSNCDFTAFRPHCVRITVVGTDLIKTRKNRGMNHGAPL